MRYLNYEQTEALVQATRFDDCNRFFWCRQMMRHFRVFAALFCWCKSRNWSKLSLESRLSAGMNRYAAIEFFCYPKFVRVKPCIGKIDKHGYIFLLTGALEHTRTVSKPIIRSVCWLKATVSVGSGVSLTAKSEVSVKGQRNAWIVQSLHQVVVHIVLTYLSTCLLVHLPAYIPGLAVVWQWALGRSLAFRYRNKPLRRFNLIAWKYRHSRNNLLASIEIMYCLSDN